MRGEGEDGHETEEDETVKGKGGNVRREERRNREREEEGGREEQRGVKREMEREGGSSNGSSPVVFHLRLHYAVTARGSPPPRRGANLSESGNRC